MEASSRLLEKSKCMNRDLINWKEVSRRLSGNDNSIRSNKCPKKYEKKVNRLLKVIELWVGWVNRS